MRFDLRMRLLQIVAFLNHLYPNFEMCHFTFSYFLSLFGILRFLSVSTLMFLSSFASFIVFSCHFKFVGALFLLHQWFIIFFSFLLLCLFSCIARSTNVSLLLWVFALLCHCCRVRCHRRCCRSRATLQHRCLHAQGGGVLNFLIFLML